ncbi:arylsulfatase B-like [Littorina saxatilis]|uniref:arylsulfatase B-like n=1 Tax=Littorina saxatilis TaxID=31220 RepID=UPI0038B42A41
MTRAVASAALLLLPLLYVLHCSNNVDAAQGQTSQPNIVILLADDLGWSDVGWRNPFMPTPTLDKMAREGMILNQSYVQQTCSPSRAALMSGRYPHHLGLQYNTIRSGWNIHLADDQPILPEALKKLGYATHMVGKWHLGFCNWRYTPTYRGFQSFYGYYNAAEDYYTHIENNGYDFRDNDQVDKSAVGHYSTNLFTDRAIRIINDHNTSQPLFLYLAYQAVHGPLQAPQEYIDQHCKHIPDNNRKIKCGMIAALDESVKNVTDAMKQRGLMDNTFILFSSDNGGPVHEYASNYPLRGSKITLWEGGTRAAAFAYAPSLLQKTNSSYEELIHITDWYPTLVEAAGGGSSVANIDGVSQWKNLLSGGPGPRQEFIYNMDEVRNDSAIRRGRYKLIQGYARNPNGWFVPPELEEALNQTTVEIHAQKNNPPYSLYDLETDPEERHNIIDSHQDVFHNLKARLDSYRPSLVPTLHYSYLKISKPANFNGNWSPGWC